MPVIQMVSVHRKAVRTAALGLLVAGVLSAGACNVHSRSGPEQVDPAAFSWSTPVSAPHTVFIRNTHGSIEVKPSSDGMVHVTAEERWSRGDPKRVVRFETAASDGDLTVCAMWGKGSCSASHYGTTVSLFDRILGRGTDATVAFMVYVPTGVQVNAITVNGSIGVEATAPVKAETVNGTIKVATSVGPVDAQTVNGNVDARMTTLGADGPVHAESVNGSVSAYLPQKFDGSVKMETVMGSLTSDIEGSALKTDPKEFSLTVGAGGRKVDISTVTGSAALHLLKPDGTVAAP